MHKTHYKQVLAFFAILFVCLMWSSSKRKPLHTDPAIADAIVKETLRRSDERQQDANRVRKLSGKKVVDYKSSRFGGER